MFSKIPALFLLRVDRRMMLVSCREVRATLHACQQLQNRNQAEKRPRGPYRREQVTASIKLPQQQKKEQMRVWRGISLRTETAKVNWGSRRTAYEASHEELEDDPLLQSNTGLILLLSSSFAIAIWETLKALKTKMDPEKKNEEKNDEEYNFSRMSKLIKKKIKGEILTNEEIDFFVDMVVEGGIQESQIVDMLKAIHSQDLDDKETTYLTKAMTNSGEVLKWPEAWKGLVVDKHSTGGVGDKVSLVLVPALAACGVKVPMVSGRGLGHTGGTLDKLESIPGFNVSLSKEEILKVVTDVGCCITGQTSELVPADKLLYEIRDVTGTVDCMGLMTSSIISKKIAESLDALVLDVKTGKGAFLQDENRARELAKRMVKAGNGSGVKTVALLTDMNCPLGHMVGNALEVEESIKCLQGDGPQDLTDLVTKLGGQLLVRVGKASELQEAYDILNATLRNGAALSKFAEMIKAQGVEAEVAENLCRRGADVFEILPKAKYATELKTEMSGYVHDIDAMKCAIVAKELGAGRTKVGDSIRLDVGLRLSTQVGEKVDEGSTWVTVYHEEETLSDGHLSHLQDALLIKQEPVRGTRVIDAIM